jgi:hypothetical protein
MLVTNEKTSEILQELMTFEEEGRTFLLNTGN